VAANASKRTPGMGQMWSLPVPEVGLEICGSNRLKQEADQMNGISPICIQSAPGQQPPLDDRRGRGTAMGNL